MIGTGTLSDRRGLWAFVLGVMAVTVGVLLHLPMFWMGRNNHYILSGMPIGWDMIAGMAAIVGGCGIAAFGLLPRDIGKQPAASQDIVVSPPEDVPLSAAHWGLMAVLVIALIIDIMKPATLGFVLPGMMSEYQVDKATVSAFPFSALVGTVVGSILWGVIADIMGRQGLDPAVRSDVRRHLHLRRHALALLARGNVLPDGACGGGNAAGDLRPSRRNDAEPASRLGARPGRGTGGGRRLLRGKRLFRLASAAIRLACPVVAQSPDRPVAGVSRRAHTRIRQVPARARTPGGSAARDGAFRIEGAQDAPRRSRCARQAAHRSR